MKVEDVRRAVARIERASVDDEQAHAMEDALRDRVLRAIARGHEAPAELAREALQTSRVEFSRWYA